MTTLFWDIDNTLIDFVASSHEAFFELCANHHLAVDEGHFARWYAFKERFWRQQEKGLITIDEIVAHQFDLLQEETHFSGNLLDFSLEFQQLLYHHAVPVAHAVETVRWCHEQGFRQFAASNGYLSQQISRLTQAGLLPYFEALFVSDDLGATKPNLPFFEKALHLSNTQPHNALMIGDNIITDVQGAHSAQINTCWFNPQHFKNETEVIPTYEIYDILEIKEILSR